LKQIEKYLAMDVFFILSWHKIMEGIITKKIEDIYLLSIKDMDKIKSMDDAFQVGIDVAHILQDIHSSLVHESDPWKRESDIKEFADATLKCFEKAESLHKQQLQKMQKQTLF
jgi:hypothetical protein